MIYNVFKIIIYWFYQMFYKRVYIQGLENIPKGKPVLLAADHTNALVDPLTVAIFLNQPIYFLARADIFANKFLVWLFKEVHMRPIYRPRDGMDYAEKNLAIFEEVNTWLMEKKTVLIFSEGTSDPVKRLRPLKKGTVRMAFNAWEQGADVYIVPTGINYTYHHNARTELFISYGKAMRIENYRAFFEENPKKAYRFANADLFKGIEAEMIIVDKTENEGLAEQMLIIGRNDFPENRFPIMSRNHRRLYYEKRITQKINDLEQNDPAGFEILKQQITQYSQGLADLQTSDKAVLEYEKANSFIVLLLAPIARILGVALHFPMRYFQARASKMTKNDPSMFMTMWSGLLMGFYLVFGFILMVLGTLTVGFLMALCFGIILVFLTYWSGVILEIRQEDKANTALESFYEKAPAKVEALKAMRLTLSKWIRS